MTPIPYTDADLAYVTHDFVSLEELCRRHGVDVSVAREHVERALLPQPSYVLPDGRKMVPDTYFALADEAGGIERLQQEFLHRCRIAAADESVDSNPEEEWLAYLSGEYGVCLREVSPENIVRKAVLVDQIEHLLEAPEQASSAWTTALRDAVEELDGLERPFAPDYDRLRFGSPSSRDRLITATRERYPAVFEPSAVAAD